MKPRTLSWLIIAAATILVLAVTSLAIAGRIGGPMVTYGYVGPYQTVRFAVPFEAGDVAAVMMIGGDSTELELCVFDGDFNVVIGEGDGNVQTAQIYVLERGVFVIVVRNLGPLPNGFTLRTN